MFLRNKFLFQIKSILVLYLLLFICLLFFSLHYHKYPFHFICTVFFTFLSLGGAYLQTSFLFIYVFLRLSTHSVHYAFAARYGESDEGKVVTLLSLQNVPFALIKSYRQTADVHYGRKATLALVHFTNLAIVPAHLEKCGKLLSSTKPGLLERWKLESPFRAINH